MEEAQNDKSQMSFSADRIGWSQFDDYTEGKRLLNLERRAEYEAHLAMKSKQKEDMRNERRQEQDRRDEEDVEDRKWLESHVILSESDVRHQDQHYYSQELHDQIVEKRRLGEERMTMEDDSRHAQQEAREARKEKKLQKEQADVKEAAQLRADGKEVLSETDVRHQKQQNYRHELDDQIVEKKRLGEERMTMEDDSRHAQQEAREARKENKLQKEQADVKKAAQLRAEGKEVLSETDVRHQKQRDFCHGLDDQIAEKKRLGVERRTMKEDSRHAQQEARDARYEMNLQMEQDDVKELAQLRADGKEVLSETDVRHQKQQNYRHELDDQIVEKKRMGVERKTMEEDSLHAQQELRHAYYEKKLQEKQDDVKELAQLRADGKEVLSETDVRHQKQQNYRHELDDQIVEKKRLGVERTENEEHAQYERHRAQVVRNEIQKQKESSEQKEADGAFRVRHPSRNTTGVHGIAAQSN